MMWMLEVALLVLLSATLFHAIRLERALGVLKRDRAALEELVTGFNSSTRAAEQGIERLRSAADGAGRQIARQTEAASGLKDDLVFLIERGERVAERLDGLVRTSRSLVQDQRPDLLRPDPLRPDPLRPDPLRFDPSRSESQRADLVRPEPPRPDRVRPDLSELEPAPRGVQRTFPEPGELDPFGPEPAASPRSPPPAPIEEPKVRSQAERDLLRALRMVR